MNQDPQDYGAEAYQVVNGDTVINAVRLFTERFEVASGRDALQIIKYHITSSPK